MSAAPVVSIESAALQKGLPANIEAEQFVLGSILLDEERTLFPQVAGALTAADFNIEKHRRIFQRMGELHGRGERVEYLTVVTNSRNTTSLSPAMASPTSQRSQTVSHGLRVSTAISGSSKTRPDFVS